MKARLIGALETVFVWTAGPLLLFVFSPSARKARFAAAAGAGVVAAAWWTGALLWLVGALVSLVPERTLGADLAPTERAFLERALLGLVDRDTPTFRHTLRMEARVTRFATAEGAHAGAVRTAVMLHDGLKDYLPKVPPQDVFCMHAETGAVNAFRTVRAMPERTPWFSVVVADAIARHMGPTGFNMDWRDKRWVSKRCDRRFAAPVSKASKVVYDLDMMDQLSLDGVVETSAARLDAPGNRESLREILKTGKDSAWKQAADAWQTLHTRTARACGRQQLRYAVAFIKGVDYRAVHGGDALREAAARFRAAGAEPPCWAAPGDALPADVLAAPASDGLEAEAVPE